jgi:hypothetical protein
MMALRLRSPRAIPAAFCFLATARCEYSPLLDEIHLHRLASASAIAAIVRVFLEDATVRLPRRELTAYLKKYEGLGLAESSWPVPCHRFGVRCSGLTWFK